MSGSTSGLPIGSSLLDGSTDQAGDPAVDSSLSIVSTEPSTSSTLALSPSTLTVKFDRPLDDFSVGGTDFELVHVEGDGSTQPLAFGEAKLVEALDPSDPTDSQIALTLTKPLIEGHYQLLSLGDNQLQGEDGTSLATDGKDVVLSDFTIGAKQAGFSSAVDLGTPTSTDTVHSDVLNLADDPAAVDYYKVTLAPGHHWRLGLEIVTQGGPGNGNTTLSLFDADGKLVATDSVGPSSDPGDPYLFAGLAPGVYYVGVSAKENVPDPSGAYNLSGKIIAPSGASRAGGPFQIHVVADVADQPTEVLGLRVDHADPLSTSPTGLTLQFGGSIRLTSLTTSAQPAVILVDQNGQDWPLTMTQYDATLGQLSFVLNQALPAGRYSLELTGQGGLVDLAGLAPVSAGLPAGVLGTFKVAPTINAPNDLGAILPSVAVSGLNANLVVAPMSSLAERFTIVVPGVYSLRGVDAASGVTFSLTDAQSDVLANSSKATEAGSADVFLLKGSYNLTLTNSNTSPEAVPITILGRGIEFSQLLDGGVGQGPAFSLRLVTPDPHFGQADNLPSTPTVTDSSSPSTSPGIGSQSPEAVSVSGGSTSAGSARDASATSILAIGTVTPVGPSSAFLLYSTGPVGHPSAQYNQISVVGPAGPSQSVALASNSGGLPPGLAVIPVAISPGEDLVPDANPMGPAPRIEGVDPLQKGSTLESGLLARSPGSRKEDDLSLAEADWFGRIVAVASGWFGRLEAVGPAVEPALVATATAQEPTGTPEIAVETRVEAATLASPIGIGVLAMIAFRYRRNLLNLARKSLIGEIEVKKQSILTGPHRRVRVTTRR